MVSFHKTILALSYDFRLSIECDHVLYWPIALDRLRLLVRLCLALLRAQHHLDAATTVDLCIHCEAPRPSQVQLEGVTLIPCLLHSHYGYTIAWKPCPYPLPSPRVCQDRIAAQDGCG